MPGIELKPTVAEIQNQVFLEWSEKYRVACGVHAWGEAQKIADKFYKVFPAEVADKLLRELRVSGECEMRMKWLERGVDYEPCRVYRRDDFTNRV